MIKKIKNSYYVTKDMDKSVVFYKDVLGLELLFRDNERWAQFTVNGSTFALSSPQEAPTEVGKGAIITFEVEDIDATVAKLKEAGVHMLDEIRDMGEHGLTVAFEDPAGNVVSLFQKPVK